MVRIRYIKTESGEVLQNMGNLIKKENKKRLSWMKSDECYSSANPTVERRLPGSLLKILKFTIYFMAVLFFGKNVKKNQPFLIYICAMIHTHYTISATLSSDAHRTALQIYCKCTTRFSR